jgi:Zn-finger nucleic acid-binding protein
MARMNFGKRSGVIVDACRMHGTWFDAGELESVLEFVAAGGMPAQAVASSTATPEVAEAVRQAEVMMKLEVLRDRQQVEENVELTKDLLDLVAYDGLRGLLRRVL